MPTWLRSHPSLAAFHLGSLAGEEEEKEPVVDPESVGVDTAGGGGLRARQVGRRGPLGCGARDAGSSGGG